jgi:malto-oligosyltrehalose trehalohydrolase
MNRRHRMPFGAEVLAGGQVRFRLWAPKARQVAVRLVGTATDLAMEPRDGGWFELTAAAHAGQRYLYVIDNDRAVPDPASRFQPEDVHGPSEIVDPHAFEWKDSSWRGRRWEEAVFYELHVGAFAPDGDYGAIMAKLDHLVELGVTAIELMPLSESPGQHNWGYDGVYPFAPEARYGRPDDLKSLVSAMHQRGLMVFLDVVYNHFGPEGNYLHSYAPQFFTERHQTPWGAAINFDGPDCRVPRDFFIQNALYWLEEYHFDGLRLDAVHAICDDSSPHILTELAETVAARLPTDRQAHLVLENDDNAARYLARDAHGQPRQYAAQWNDDLHHALHVLVTGEKEGYFEDYAERPVAQFGRALAEGFIYQGEPSRHRGGKNRGEPSGGLPPTAFVSFLQNHDQVGNRAMGERIFALAAPEAVRAAMAAILMAPAPPLLFMGEEWGARQTFPFFCDFGPDLADSVREGRRREFSRFPEFASAEAREHIPDPVAPGTFAGAVLDWSDLEKSPHREWLAFYRKLLQLRRTAIMPRLPGIVGGAAHYDLPGDTPSAGGLLRVAWRLGDGSRLTLIANMAAAEASAAGMAAPDAVIYATHSDWDRPAPRRRLSPWSVAWFLGVGSNP